MAGSDVTKEPRFEQSTNALGQRSQEDRCAWRTDAQSVSQPANRIRRRVGRNILALSRLAGALLVLGIVWWWVSSTSAIAAKYVLPPIPVVWADFVELVRSGVLFKHIFWSLFRVLGGFLLAVVTVVPFGLLLGRYRRLYLFFEPIIELLRPVSPIAWIPLAILWFGIGEASKFFLVWLVCCFVILVNTIAGVTAVDRRLVDAALTLGTRRRKLFTKVIFPAALPAILTGMRIGLGLAFVAVVVAEMIAARSGVGFMMERARATMNPSHVIVGMIVLGLLGYLLNEVIGALFQGRRFRGSAS